MKKQLDPELQAIAIAEERAWRTRAILRISELTSRVPHKVVHGDARLAVLWRQDATKASRLIEQRAPATKSLRNAIAHLEQYE